MKVCLQRLLDRPYSAEFEDAVAALAHRDRVGRHTLVDDPAAADAIVFVDLHLWDMYDPFLRALRSHELVRRFPAKVAVYDERDRPVFTLPGAYVSPLASQVAARPVGAMTYLRLAPPAVDPGVEPDLLFSFRGARSHPLRAAVLDLRHPRAEVEDSSAVAFMGGGTDTAEHDAARARYAELVARSKFVLCPRGHGTSSYRLYETLLAGRVPVVLSDAWVPPAGIDWSSCAVRLPQDDLASLPRRLEEAEARWPQLRAGVARAVDEHLGDDVRWTLLCDTVEAQLRRPRPRTPWWWNTHVPRTAVARARRLVRGRGQRWSS